MVRGGTCTCIQIKTTNMSYIKNIYFIHICLTNVSMWLLFNTKLSNFSGISWLEHVTYVHLMRWWWGPLCLDQHLKQAC